MAEQNSDFPDGGGDNQPLAGYGDGDAGISNTGQRIRAIIIAVVIVGAAIGAFVWWSGQKAAVEAHKKVRADFQHAHTVGYKDFWIAAKVDIKEMKSNQDFDTELKKIISLEPVRYSKYIKEKALPILDKALPKYKKITVPSVYADKMAAMVKAAEGLREAWGKFADELHNFDAFEKGMKVLDDHANAWLGAQQYRNDKFTAKAYKYFRLLQCVLQDEKIEEIETTNINYSIKNSCAKGDVKAAWFRHVGYDCLPRLLEEAGEPDDIYRTTLAKSRKADRMDHASKFGIEDCIKSSRDELESELIEGVAKAWAEYVKAQNELLTAIESELKKLS